MQRRKLHGPRRKGSASFLEPGPDTCSFCLLAFHIESACYCAECDRPVCPACVRMHNGVRLLCPDCDAGLER